MVIEGNLQNIGGCRQNFEFRWRLRDEEGCKLRQKIKLKRYVIIKKTFEIAYEMSTNAKIPYIFRRHFVGRFEDDIFYG